VRVAAVTVQRAGINTGPKDVDSGLLVYSTPADLVVSLLTTDKNILTGRSYLLSSIMVKLLGAAAALLGTVAAQNTSLPVVDLGYEIYRASSFNVSVVNS
jgi:hypothetical protein